MIHRKIVTPAAYSGRSFSWHPKGPMFAIECGECHCTFSERVPVIDYPKVLCPACGSLNQLDLEVDR